MKIVVVAGGHSNEREVSLMTGKQIASALKSDHQVDLLELKEPHTYIDNLRAIKDKADLVFIALHGKYGEDGLVQAVLDLLEIPYTGSGVLASALAMDKVLTFDFLQKHGIQIADYFVIYNSYKLDEVKEHVIKRLDYPCIVKPNKSGSSVGISLVEDEDKLEKALQEALQEDGVVIIQKYIKGRELTCAVMGNSHQTDLETLPVAEIITNEGKFFDYNNKYFSDKTEEVAPADVDPKVAEKVQLLAKKAHLVIGCRGLTRSDFILSKEDQLYFLEINTIPGQTEASLCPKEAKAAGMSFQEFILKQVDLAKK